MTTTSHQILFLTRRSGRAPKLAFTLFEHQARLDNNSNRQTLKTPLTHAFLFGCQIVVNTYITAVEALPTVAAPGMSSE